mgnify:CR=1 FL=1
MFYVYVFVEEHPSAFGKLVGVLGGEIAAGGVARTFLLNLGVAHEIVRAQRRDNEEYQRQREEHTLRTGYPRAQPAAHHPRAEILHRRFTRLSRAY